jgi:hypothetical protein
MGHHVRHVSLLFFSASFFNFISEKKDCPDFFLQGLFVYVFLIPMLNFIKKIPISHFLVMRK